jgi:hypothetical protein
MLPACGGDDAGADPDDTGSSSSSATESDSVDPDTSSSGAIDPDTSGTVADSSTSTSTSTSTGEPGTTAESSSTEASSSSEDSGDTSSTGGMNVGAFDDDVRTVQDRTLEIPAPYGVLANDVGDGVTVVAADAVSLAGGAVAVAADGAVTYTPAAGFAGVDSFGYTISDGTEEASAQMTVRVAAMLVIDGEDANDYAGQWVRAAGDVNDDGYDDLIVTADRTESNGPLDGRSYVVFGKPDKNSIALADIAMGTGGFAIDAAELLDASGRAVSGAGDMNADGFADLILGADLADAAGEDAGGAYVVFGKADTSVVEIADIQAGIGGFAMTGAQAGDSAGRQVADAGDVDGDGLDDVVIAAYLADGAGEDSGAVYVVFGRAGTEPVALADVALGIGGFAILGEAQYHNAGLAVSGAGDVDGDGLADVILSAPGADPNGELSGRCYVVFGKADTTPVDLVDVADGTGGFVMNGEGADAYAGFEVSGAGDVDADGLADVILSAPGTTVAGVANAGRSYVVFGKADTLAVELADIGLGSGGFAIDGFDDPDFTQQAVTGLGDVDGDGFADVAVGAPYVSTDSLFHGYAWIVSGKADTEIVELERVGAGSGGLGLQGEAQFDFMGRPVASAGDFDQDGLADTVTCAISHDANGDSSGRCYMIFGMPASD